MCFIKEVFILHSKQQNYRDLKQRLLFSVFWLSISAIIRQEYGFTKRVNERGSSLQTVSIKYFKIHDYYAENRIITDIKINNASIVSKRTFFIVLKTHTPHYIHTHITFQKLPLLKAEAFEM